MKPGGDHESLSRRDEGDAERRSAPRAAVIYEAIRHEAVEELARGSGTRRVRTLTCKVIGGVSAH